MDEESLIKALQEGWIAHAALDVLEKEPPSHNNPILSMENVTLTAHVASASARFDEARKRRVGYELSLVLQGMWPVSCVNPSVLQNTALRRWQPVSMDRGPEQLGRQEGVFGRSGERSAPARRNNNRGKSPRFRLESRLESSPAVQRREQENRESF